MLDYIFNPYKVKVEFNNETIICEIWATSYQDACFRLADLLKGYIKMTEVKK